MKVAVDVYTKNLDAVLDAFKSAYIANAKDMNLRVNEEWNTKTFENFELTFEADHKSSAIEAVNTEDFKANADDL
jgi:hypothetical protein